MKLFCSCWRTKLAAARVFSRRLLAADEVSAGVVVAASSFAILALFSAIDSLRLESESSFWSDSESPLELAGSLVGGSLAVVLEGLARGRFVPRAR